MQPLSKTNGCELNLQHLLIINLLMMLAQSAYDYLGTSVQRLGRKAAKRLTRRATYDCPQNSFCLVLLQTEQWTLDTTLGRIKKNILDWEQCRYNFLFGWLVFLPPAELLKEIKQSFYFLFFLFLKKIHFLKWPIEKFK